MEFKGDPVGMHISAELTWSESSQSKQSVSCPFFYFSLLPVPHLALLSMRFKKAFSQIKDIVSIK